MAEKKEIEIYFKIEGLKAYISDLETLDSVLKQVNAATEQAKEETASLEKEVDNTGKSANKASGFFGKIGTVGVNAFKGLKTAIAATGIGLLLTALGQLVAWFAETDTGAKVLRATTAALGVVFERISGFITTLGEKLTPLFENPKQALKDFGELIKTNITNRFEGILEFIPAISTAIKQLFEGDFAAAATTAGNAYGKVLLGVEDVVGKVGDVVGKVGAAVGDIVDDIGEAVKTSNSLVTAEKAFAKLQNTLLVENAKLNKELETQKKIAEDTTRSYDERKAALDRVNAANEQLAANNLREANANKALIQQKLSLAKTDSERRELQKELAEATATQIEAEQQVAIVKLESAQLGRELDQEEADRKKGILDVIKGINAETIQDERAKVEESIKLAREQTIAELTLQKAEAEQIAEVNAAFDKLREQQLQEITDKETADAEAKAKTITDILANASKTQSEIAYQRLQDELEAQRLADEVKLIQAGATAEQLQQLNEAYAGKRLKLAEDEAERLKQLDKDVQLAKLQIAGQAIDAITALQAAFASQSEKDAEKNFKIQKALSLASATIKGVEATINAFTTAAASPITSVFPAYPAIQASIAGAFAAAQIATIARSKFNPGGGTDINVNNTPPPTAALPSVGTGGGGPTITPGQTSSGQSTQTEPIRAYVLVSDVNNAQQANQQIENLAKL